MKYCLECQSTDLLTTKNQTICNECGALLVDELVFDVDLPCSQTYQRNTSSKTKSIYNRWSLLFNKISKKHQIDFDPMFLRNVMDYLFQFIEIFYDQYPDRQNMICTNHLINRYCRKYYPQYQKYFTAIKTASTLKRADQMIDAINLSINHLTYDLDQMNLIKVGTHSTFELGHFPKSSIVDIQMKYHNYYH